LPDENVETLTACAISKKRRGVCKLKVKVAKKRRVSQQFRPEYSVAYPVIRKSAKDCYHAFCSLCSVDINVSHGGIQDVKKHVLSSKHDSKAKLNNVKKLPVFFSSSSDLSVVNAEVLFTEFLIEHSIPFTVADHAGALFRRMFPDSQIARKYGCGRTKTACIIEALVKEDSENIADVIKSSPFSIATDGSNDYRAKCRSG
jgi:hypothetical protein